LAGYSIQHFFYNILFNIELQLHMLVSGNNTSNTMNVKVKIKDVGGRICH